MISLKSEVLLKIRVGIAWEGEAFAVYELLFKMRLIAMLHTYIEECLVSLVQHFYIIL